MKNSIYTLSAYTLTALLAFSFYFTLFHIAAFSPLLSVSIVLSMVVIGYFMITDAEFISEMEE